MDSYCGFKKTILRILNPVLLLVKVRKGMIFTKSCILNGFEQEIKQIQSFD